MKETLKALDTEQRNEKTRDIDALSTLDMVSRINEEDARCAMAVQAALPQITASIDVTADRVKKGGRLFYIGAGTSGRLGVLDAAECPPTFGVSPELVVGIIAGGARALTTAVEGAEDDEAQGAEDLKARGFSEKDVLVGIAASGRTPYVLGAMRYAKALGANVIALVCARGSAMAAEADIAITLLPGPEVITGSTRMKAGTCQKLVLNLLSTGVMIRLGKVYGNLMVDVKATNEKLRDRAKRIVMEAADVDEETAAEALKECDGSCKTAIVALKKQCSPKEAEALLKKAEGRVAEALSDE